MSKRIDFGCVRRDHVVLACRKILSSGSPIRCCGRSAFIRFEENLLPAKYVVGQAYEIATGISLDPGDFTGGESSAKILRGLGFKIEGPGILPPTRNPAERPPSKPSQHPSGSTDTGKTCLLAEMKSHFEVVKTEVTFPWLVVPEVDQLEPEIKRIRDALCEHRGFSAFDTPGYQLRCDFFLPRRNAIVEVDERQHFTKPRALALRNYPASTSLGFDRGRWIEDCECIAATDPSPPHRDEQRAYYDSLRDLLTAKNGVLLIRIPDTKLLTHASVSHTLREITNALGLGGS